MLDMLIFCIIAGLSANAFAGQAELENILTNGGFEQLSPQDLPIGWGGFSAEGASFGISSDAHSGKYALRMKSPSEAIVGINRSNDSMIPIIRGVAKFWYKAISSEVKGKNLQVYIIGMNQAGDNEVGRYTFTVPPEHVGDNQWHLGEIPFDFRQRDDAKNVHFAPRINETLDKGAGEMLIDDAVVTMIGTKLVIKSFGSAKPIIKVAEVTDISLVIENIGDLEAKNVEVKLDLPDGLIADNSQNMKIEKFLPDQTTKLSWQVTAQEAMSGVIKCEIDSSLSQTFFITSADIKEPALKLENEHIGVDFFKTDQGYGVFMIRHPQVANDSYFAQSSMFSRLIYRTNKGNIEYAPIFADDYERNGSKYIFKKRFVDVDKVVWNFRFTFDLPTDQKWVDVTYSATAEKEREVLAFYGTMLYTSRQSRYDAVFSGLEYLENNEISSSTLDIAPPNHIRRVPHPNKVTIPLMAVSENVITGKVITGMMWNAKKTWAKEFDRPSALFASPNWFESMDNYDVMGVFVPSVPDWVEENNTQAKTPYKLNPKDFMEINTQLFCFHKGENKASAVYAIPYWIEKYGLSDPLSLPRKTLDKELEFSLNAYMNTLWLPDKQTWHNTLDWDPWGASVNPEFARQLWLSAKILPSNPKKAEYLERAELAIKNMKRWYGKDFPFYIGGLDRLYPGYRNNIIGLIDSQNEDGSWRFDPDVWNKNDTIPHLDYHKLGKKDDVELGLCAQKAYTLLKYTRMTGDKASLDAGLKALAFMGRFTIPRASQVWEVPVHTPDVLASAHGVQAYLEAYKITNKPSYLFEAVYWAYTGLPFVYLWNNSDMPYMLYASIPVFGATWFTGSWFGVAVQWNGLDYANALYDLAQYDKSLPWKKIADGLTISALYQQETNKKYEGLYPDAYDFMTKAKSAWKLSPSLLIRNLFVMMGYSAEPCTTVVGSGDEKIRISSALQIKDAVLSDGNLKFSLNYPSEMDAYIMIAGIDKPPGDSVLKDQNIINETQELGTESWKYDPSSGLLFMKLKRIADVMKVEIKGVKSRYAAQIRSAIDKINWQFKQGGIYDWLPASDLDSFAIRDGYLITKSIGSDPYMVCEPTKIKASEYSEIAIRMRTSKGEMAQFFWSTESEPLGEANSISFPIVSDGRIHEYVIPVGKHNNWKGTITSIRLDPTNSSDSEIIIESIIGRNVKND
jgi:hypothetical protein